MLLTLLLILLAVSLLGGVWGNRGGRAYGYAGWSPFGILLVVLLILFLTGNLGQWGLRSSGGNGPVILHNRR
jgi:hypothetical protein